MDAISPMTSLVGSSLLGHIFIQDRRPEWIKIDGVVMGETPKFGYKTIVNPDIGGLLDSLVKDGNVTAVLYNWKNGKAYIKKGINLSDPADYALNPVFTTFLAKSKVSSVPPVPPVPSAPVPPTGTFVRPYCMPGSDTMRKCIAAVPPGKLNFTLAFWNGGGWDSGDPDGTLISDVRSKGGDFVVSFGGQAGCSDGNEPALQGGTANDVLERYSVPISRYSLKYADFDIEGGKENEKSSYQLRNSAIALLQKRFPGLKVSFTVPADSGGVYCLDMLTDARSKGVVIDTVNGMWMDAGKSVDLVSWSVSGVKECRAQLNGIGMSNVKIGYTPLLMKDDGGINTYTLANHVSVVSQLKGIVTTFAFWELAIDAGNDFQFVKALLV